MFSPKKESCIKALGRSADLALTFGSHLAGAPDRAASGDSPRLRDKALPDRLVITTLVCDALIIVYALIFAYWFRFQTAFGELGLHAPLSLQQYSGYIALGSLTLILTLTSFGIYERNALLRFHFVSSQIVKASLLWAAGFLSFVLMFRFEPPISRLFILTATILTPGALLAWRWLLHRYLRRSAVAMNLRQRIVFVGWNEESENLSSTFAHPGSAYEVVGCIGSMRARFQRRPKVRILGQFDDLVDVIQRMSIDMVMLTDVNCVKGEIVSLANTCERAMVHFKVIPSYFQILVSGLHLETVGGVPVLGVSRLPLDRLAHSLLKRLVDIVGSIIGLILSAPIMAVCAVLIRRESPGPIFFGQERIGRKGDPFKMYKLRSMKLGADKSDHLNQSTQRNDPRLLRIGAFIRRWNIDETPQFWNVLKGDMSLVGPRPERCYHSEKLSEEIPHYNARYGIKPGMTGWAQVRGFRGATDLEERIKCDLWYLENWSPMLDLQIMALTFLRREQAY